MDINYQRHMYTMILQNTSFLALRNPLAQHWSIFVGQNCWPHNKMYFGAGLLEEAEGVPVQGLVTHLPMKHQGRPLHAHLHTQTDALLAVWRQPVRRGLVELFAHLVAVHLR
jgi:hypothetical protein